MDYETPFGERVALDEVSDFEVKARQSPWMDPVTLGSPARVVQLPAQPTPSEAYYGRLWTVRGESAPTGIYTCLLDSEGAYEIVQIAVGTTVSP